MTSPGVVPAFNPGEYCQAGFGTGSEGFTINEFALETSEETLRHGIIKRIANRSHGRSHAHLAAAIAEGHAGVLASLIAVMNNLFGAALLQSHIQCTEHQISAHLLTDRPADHAAAPCIEDHGQIDKSRPGGNIGHIGHPQGIGRVRLESTLHQIRRWPLTLIAPGCHDVGPAPADALQTRTAHQASYTLTTDCHTLIS